MTHRRSKEAFIGFRIDFRGSFDDFWLGWSARRAWGGLLRAFGDFERLSMVCFCLFLAVLEPFLPVLNDFGSKNGS